MPYPPFCVFAEATSTNGSVLFPFKRGAFEGMRTVIPSYLEFKTGMISPNYDTVDFIPHAFLLFSSLQVGQVTLKIFPEFTPNSRMLDMHSDKAD